MKAVIATVISAMALTACASVQATTPLHEMAREDAPMWDMVSLQNLDEAFKASFERKTMIVEFGGAPIPLEFEGVNFEEFKKVEASTRIYKRNDNVFISFDPSSCKAGIGVSYELVEEALEFKSFHQPGPACSRMVRGKSGKQYNIPTHYLVQTKFMEIAPQVKWYDVSSDGNALTLLDSENQELALFSLVEAAE